MILVNVLSTTGILLFCHLVPSDLTKTSTQVSLKKLPNSVVSEIVVINVSIILHLMESREGVLQKVIYNFYITGSRPLINDYTLLC